MERLQIEQCKKCPYVRKSLLDKILSRIPENTDCDGAIEIEEVIASQPGFAVTIFNRVCPKEVTTEDIKLKEAETDERLKASENEYEEWFKSLSPDQQQEEVEASRRLVHEGE